MKRRLTLLASAAVLGLACGIVTACANEIEGLRFTETGFTTKEATCVVCENIIMSLPASYGTVTGIVLLVEPGTPLGPGGGAPDSKYWSDLITARDGLTAVQSDPVDAAWNVTGASVVIETGGWQDISDHFNILNAAGERGDGRLFVLSDLDVNPSPIPGPVVGAGLPGLLAGFGAMLAWHRRRRAVAI